MGIKKEREAFERLPLAELAIESEFVFYNEETNSYWPNEDFCPSDAPETMNFAWEAWQAAKAHEAEKLKGCVLVPVQCPDPDFADSLFDELSKKAIGEFGDDLLIHFSNIDEEKIWALMVGAAKAQAVPEWISVEDKLPETEPNTDGVVCAVVCSLGNVYRARYVHDVDIGVDTKYWSEFAVNYNGREYEHYEINAKISHWIPLPDAPQEPANE